MKTNKQTKTWHEISMEEKNHNFKQNDKMKLDGQRNKGKKCKDDKQIDRQTYINRQINRYIDRQTDIQIHTQIDRHTYRQTGGQGDRGLDR